MKNCFCRRNFLKSMGNVTGSLFISSEIFAENPPDNRPNIILCMADDQGWSDTGYNGHPVLKTPNLDEMSRNGIRFDRFYSGAPVCSPTRGSCLTGRHPYRYGIFSANVGHMRKEEVTLAEVLKTQGYVTGHFGKWHLGTLTKTRKDSNRGGPDGAGHYSPPWENGFDVCFSTEAKVPTWNPMVTPNPSAGGVRKQKTGEHYGTYYWIGHEKTAEASLEGDDSRIIMDRAIPFIRDAIRLKKPFCAVIWFHAPHLPVIAGSDYLEMYSDQPVEKRHFYGCLTALDEQVGRLRRELRKLNAADNTMLWYCSDNGPELERVGKRTQGSAGLFRGRKRSLFEGGVCVPGLLEWPAKIATPRVVSMPCCTHDYFPTIMDILGFKMEGQSEPLDGISLLPLIKGKMESRPVPIGFESGKQVALIDNRYKLISQDSGETYMLFDLTDDPGETLDIAHQNPEVVRTMKITLDRWRASCKLSFEGSDYH